MPVRSVTDDEYGKAEKRGRRRVDPELVEKIKKVREGEKFFYEFEEGEQETTAKARIKRIARDLKVDVIVETLAAEDVPVLGVRKREESDPPKRPMPAAAREARRKKRANKQ